VGVGGWEPVSTSDAPLPLAIAQVTGDNHWIYSTVIIIGLFGLVASFHGIILAAGRATFEFGRVGYAPASMGKVHPKTQTPAHALLFNMGIGIIALLTGKTGEIITIACFGALALYIISMVALFVLRKNEAELERPFRVPFYPVLPATALIIASVAFAAITLYNLNLALIFFAIMGLSFLGYLLLIRDKINTT
jgi:ethanolamine permease